MDIKTYLEKLQKNKKIEFNNNSLRDWSKSVSKVIKKYKSNELERLESNERDLNNREEQYRHELTITKRAQIENKDQLEKQKEIDKKNTKNISLRIENYDQELKKIKTLPIESIELINPQNKNYKIPIFIIGTQLLKINSISNEELKENNINILNRRRFTNLFNREIGKFLIILDFNRQKNYAINITNNCHDSYDHPCISNANICFGNKDEKAYQLIKEYNIFDLLDLTIDLITNPITGSPYIHWSNWFEDLKPTDIKRTTRLLENLIVNSSLDNTVNGYDFYTNPSGYATLSGYTTQLGSANIDNGISDLQSESILENSRELISERVREMLDSFVNQPRAVPSETNEPVRTPITNGAQVSSISIDEATDLTSEPTPSNRNRTVSWHRSNPLLRSNQLRENSL